jgi:hypothetical protein
MHCPGCKHKLADDEPVFQVRVASGSAWARARLVHDQYSTVGHVCTQCRDELDWSPSPERIAKQCKHCHRPVFNLARWAYVENKIKHVACCRRCRIALYNAYARRRRTTPDKRVCACGKAFTPRRSDAIHCSSACRQRAYRERAQ